MRNEIIINRGLKDLNPLVLGEEFCDPGHRFGPYVRKYVLIHTVLSGKGKLQKNGQTYEIHPGEAFLILPGEITTYEADKVTPWHYQWIGFDGELAEKFSSLPPVFPLSGKWTQEMLDIPADTDLLEYRIASVLIRLFAELFSEKKEINRYVQQVKDYIRALYMLELKVEDIAEKVNLDRRYLTRIFRKETGQTVQEYLISVRLEEAKRQLENGASVSSAAKLCGYADVFNFSKMFKKKFGISPGKWKSDG